MPRAASEPLPPETSSPVQEAAERMAIAYEAVVAVVPAQLQTEHALLLTERHVAIRAHPQRHAAERATEARLGRLPSHHRIALLASAPEFFLCSTGCTTTVSGPCGIYPQFEVASRLGFLAGDTPISDTLPQITRIGMHLTKWLTGSRG